MIKLSGIPASKGISIAHAYVYQPEKITVVPAHITETQADGELARYRHAMERARAELLEIQASFSEEDAMHAAIFNAHVEILQDVALEEEVTRLVRTDCCQLEYAIDTAFGQFIELLSSLDDPLLLERCADLKDVKERLLYACMGKKKQSLSQIEKPAVLFAYDLFPSDTATLNREKVVGIVTEIGGTTSHSAILARSYGIPAVLGVPQVLKSVESGTEVIVNGSAGEVLLAPDAQTREEYTAKQAAYKKAAAELAQYFAVPPITKDGTHIDVCLNIGSADDDELTDAPVSDGVGLFRSEFLYMQGSELPSEEAQFEAYKKAAMVFGERQMIVRTLDIGGDKTLACMDLPKEDNPFLGCRALRLCFAQQPLFKTQLRAMLRASAYGNLAIMFPMVSSMEDIRRAKTCVQEAKDELKREGIPFRNSVALGIMIEIPSIALMADAAAKEVDFASVGTNDLCQYLLAVDRLNPAISSYYQSYHPALFRLIGEAAQAFARENKTLSICGELGGDPYAAAIFIGLGIKKLSMSASSISSVKKLITGIDLPFTQKIAAATLQMRTAEEVESYLKETLKELV